MSPSKHIKDDLSEFEALLPWYVAGTLEPEAMRRMDAALEASPELQRLLDLTLEEQHQSIRLNEDLGAPSSSALPDLMARIAAEPQPSAFRPGLTRRIGAWLGGLTASFSPAALGVSAAAAALVICVQAALIAGLVYKSAPEGAVYQTASHGGSKAVSPGPHALIAFQPRRTASEMAEFLSGEDLRIIDGPRPGGFYLVRFAGKTGIEAAKRKIKALSARSDMVRFIALSD